MDPDRGIEQIQADALAALNAADWRLGERLGRELIEAANKSGDLLAKGMGFTYVGNARLLSGDGPGAETAYAQAIKLYKKIGDEVRVAQVMMNLGIIAVEINLDVREGRRLYDLALPVVRAAGDKGRVALGLGNVAEIWRMEGDYDRAMACALESAELFDEIRQTERAAWQRINIAHLYSLRREYAAAWDCMRAASEELKRNHIAHWQAFYFDVWLIIAADVGALESAARMLGFSDEFRHQKSVPRLQGILPWFVPTIEKLKKKLGEERLAELRASGALLTMDEADALAQSYPLNA